MSGGESHPVSGSPVVKAKTERLAAREIFTRERDERLDPFQVSKLNAPSGTTH
jgi:hypothetical protein